MDITVIYINKIHGELNVVFFLGVVVFFFFLWWVVVVVVKDNALTRN